MVFRRPGTDISRNIGQVGYSGYAPFSGLAPETYLYLTARRLERHDILSKTACKCHTALRPRT